MSACGFVHVSAVVPSVQKRATYLLELELTDSCEPPNRSSAKIATIINHSAIHLSSSSPVFEHDLSIYALDISTSIL